MSTSTSEGVRGWLAQWIAPPTLISLVAFAGLTSVAHYRLGELEKDLAEIKARIESQDRVNAATYQRRDVLLEQLRLIDDRVRGIADRILGIEEELRSHRDRRTP